MLSADFASATVLISFGAVLGKTSPLQLIVMAFIEVILSQINEWIGLEKLGVSLIHTNINIVLYEKGVGFDAFAKSIDSCQPAQSAQANMS